jgi:hypothetical protein
METSSDYRTKEERNFETLNIIFQLKQNNISSKIPAVRELLTILNTYVTEGKPQKFEIESLELGKRFVGNLPIHKKFNCEVIMKSL